MNIVATSQITIVDLNDSLFTPNLLQWSKEWVDGTGSLERWTAYGDAAENVRASLPDAYGYKSIIWRCVPDADGGASGGFTVVPQPLNREKTYRFTCFVKRVGNGVGTIQHGCGGVKDMAGNTVTTGYFCQSNELTIGKWYLLVGFIHPETDTVSFGKSGIYDMRGRLLSANNEYKFSSGVTPSFFTRLTGGVNAVSEYQLFNPTFECIDGTEESISDLVQYNASEFDYLTAVMEDGTTTTEGGLLTTNLILAAGLDKKVRSGMSGIAEDNIGFFTGGNYNDAITDKAATILYKDGSIRAGNGAMVYDKTEDKFTIGDFRIIAGEIIGLDDTDTERVRMSRSALPSISSMGSGWAYFGSGITGEYPAMVSGDEAKALPSDKWVTADGSGNVNTNMPYTLERTITFSSSTVYRLEDVAMDAWIYNEDPDNSTISATWGL
jgi:hypothetical protein